MTLTCKLSEARVPVVGFVAPSGTGKTTLLSALIKLLTAWGLRVGVVKQARADFDMDQPGKDSYRLRKAGIERLLLVSEKQSALFLEHPNGSDPQLNELLTLLDQDALDLILVEGFTEQSFAKIELSRQGSGPPRYLFDPCIIALATDRAQFTQASIPLLDIDDPKAVADFLLDYLHLANRA